MKEFSIGALECRDETYDIGYICICGKEVTCVMTQEEVKTFVPKGWYAVQEEYERACSLECLVLAKQVIQRSVL